MKREQVTAVVILILAAIAAVFLSQSEREFRSKHHSKAVINIRYENEKLYKVDYKTIKNIKNATFKTNFKDEISIYTGIQLKEIFEYLNIKTNHKNKIIVNGLDGYTVSFSHDEVLMDDNVYIVYRADGMFLKSMEDSGPGPYLAIVRKDRYFSRWCKWVTEIQIQ
ncbi:MAG: molybdopterin-dependent oxidoreductase [Bacillota bacterium]